MKKQVSFKLPIETKTKIISMPSSCYFSCKEAFNHEIKIEKWCSHLQHFKRKGYVCHARFQRKQKFSKEAQKEEKNK